MYIQQPYCSIVEVNIPSQLSMIYLIRYHILTFDSHGTVATVVGLPWFLKIWYTEKNILYGNL